MTLIEEIQKFKDEKGWSTYELAHQLRLPKETCYSWFNGSAKSLRRSTEHLVLMTMAKHGYTPGPYTQPSLRRNKD